MTGKIELMNREQRRKAAKAEAKQRRAMWPSGDVEVPDGYGIKPGDKITIGGVRRNQDGTISRHCVAGEETVFTAQING